MSLLELTEELLKHIEHSIPQKGPSMDSDRVDLDPKDARVISVTKIIKDDGRVSRASIEIHAEVPGKGPVTFYIAPLLEMPHDDHG